MNYKYAVIDSLGRVWAKTLTSLKAARLVKELYQTKGLSCHVETI